MLIHLGKKLAGSNTVESEVITVGQLLMQAKQEFNEVLEEIKSILTE